MPARTRRSSTCCILRLCSARNLSTSACWTANCAVVAREWMSSFFRSISRRLPDSRADVCESFRSISGTSPSLASSSSRSAWSFACSCSDSTRATSLSWLSSWLSSCTRRSSSRACAPRSCDSASTASSCSSGLLSTSSTESGVTSAPGRITIRSTRPWFSAGMNRISSGTSVPRPRTWRSIGPRLTVSIQTVDSSTVGAAGFNRLNP